MREHHSLRDGDTVWAGVIDCDREVGGRSRPTNPANATGGAELLDSLGAARFRVGRMGTFLHSVRGRSLPRHSRQKFSTMIASVRGAVGHEFAPAMPAPETDGVRRLRRLRNLRAATHGATHVTASPLSRAKSEAAGLIVLQRKSSARMEEPCQKILRALPCVAVLVRERPWLKSKFYLERGILPTAAAERMR